jgi:hypothetical protein
MMKMNNSKDPVYGEIIHIYARAEMLEHGDLVDVSGTAKEAGFRFPVAMTRFVWDGYVVPSELDKTSWCQDVDGRLWDTISMLLVAIRSGQRGARVDFQVLYRMNGFMQHVKLKAVIGPGDQGEPVITIMLPEELD